MALDITSCEPQSPQVSAWCAVDDSGRLRLWTCHTDKSRVVDQVLSWSSSADWRVVPVTVTMQEAGR